MRVFKFTVFQALRKPPGQQAGAWRQKGGASRLETARRKNPPVAKARTRAKLEHEPRKVASFINQSRELTCRQPHGCHQKIQGCGYGPVIKKILPSTHKALVPFGTA